MLKGFIGFILITIAFPVVAQQRWDLRSVVEYAMKNNISARQLDVQTLNAELTHKQSKLSQYPNAQVQLNGSVNSGSNQDPTSFNRITQTYFSTGYQLQTSVDIFNWYSKRNTITANEWEVKAAMANADKLRYDIALQAANSYLQILLAMEQQKVMEVQMEQIRAQLAQTRKMVNAGSLPELNATQLEAQLALDSVNYINARGNVAQSILALKNWMSLDAGAPFEIEAPDVNAIPIEPIGDLQPEYVYGQAIINLPQQRYNDLKIQAANFNRDAARGAMYPSINAFGGIGTNHNSQAMHVTGINSINAPLGKVDVGGVNYDVFPLSPYNTPVYSKTPYFTQLGDFFRQSIGLGVTIPIFNGGALRTNYERSKLNIQSLELQKTADNLKLKQDIYTAYTQAIVALEKYNASKISEASSQRAFDFAQKRYNVGMLNTFELITAQNNLLRAKLETVINHFDHVFKMKVLEFYKGAGLKL